MSSNMDKILERVRAHIMTGKSASTPAFDPYSKKAPKEPNIAKEEPAAPSKPKTPKASSFKFPSDDEYGG